MHTQCHLRLHLEHSYSFTRLLKELCCSAWNNLGPRGRIVSFVTNNPCSYPNNIQSFFFSKAHNIFLLYNVFLAHFCTFFSYTRVVWYSLGQFRGRVELLTNSASPWRCLACTYVEMKYCLCSLVKGLCRCGGEAVSLDGIVQFSSFQVYWERISKNKGEISKNEKGHRRGRL